MIATQRLRIKRWSRTDRAALAIILGSADVMEFSDTGALSSIAQDAWLESALGHPPKELPLGKWAIEAIDPCAVIGYVSLLSDRARVRDSEVELGFRLSRAAWGQGYATEAAKAIIAAARGLRGLQRVVAIVDPNNHRSVRVVRKLGMIHLRDVSFDGYDHPDHVYAVAL